MKKLLLLFLLPLLFACSKDDDDKTVYLDNSPLLGSWYHDNQGGAYDVYIFYETHAITRILDKYTQDVRSERNRGRYERTEDKIYFTYANNTSFKRYKLSNDTLYIMNNSIYVPFAKKK